MELTLFYEDSNNHHSSFVGLTPKFGVPLVAFLVLISITIVYLRYKIERKTYTHMVPLYKQYARRQCRIPQYPGPEESENGLELRDLNGLPCYTLVKPPPEYQIALNMPRPDSPHDHERVHQSDRYILVPNRII